VTVPRPAAQSSTPAPTPTVIPT